MRNFPVETQAGRRFRVSFGTKVPCYVPYQVTEIELSGEKGAAFILLVKSERALLRSQQNICFVLEVQNLRHGDFAKGESHI